MSCKLNELPSHLMINAPEPETKWISHDKIFMS